MEPVHASSRRDFLLSAAVIAGAASLASCASGAGARRPPANGRLRIAQIGCGGKGLSDMQACAKEHDIVALCDVDEGKAAQARKEHPKATFYHDYRDLLDREQVDAVVVSTPDHSHAVPALIAMELGYHVFVQKPLTHTVEEARLLTKVARRKGVITSMGNQGTCLEGFRSAAEAVRSGSIGDVTEVHVWTDRPIWPQGIARPSWVDPIPATFRWDLWLGPAAHRPYAAARKDQEAFKGYAPFQWRGWWDFGTGALGDMACHVANLPFFALELGSPEWIEAEASDHSAETAPKSSIVRYRFPARGAMPPVDFTWYDGGKLPPETLLPGVKLRSGGFMLVGSKGTLYSPTDYGETFQLYMKDGSAPPAQPKPWLPRAPVSGGVHEEWLAGILSGRQPMASFDYAGPFTEAMLLGNLAIRLQKKIVWDPAAMKAVGVPEADALIRKQYRRGFELPVTA